MLTRTRPQRAVLCRSSHRAAATADMLDRIVDRDLALVRALPDELRARHADRLAAIVMLAQAYRHHAAGWIGRRELRARSREIVTQLAGFVEA